ncbi:MAG: adenine phosphoribosyltransferase [Sciscionella sp.]|nr:adenine phosphoribosyltransferase [Sciscionella sp.]
MNVPDVLRLVRDVPDFPTPGVLFRDLSPVFADPDAFASLIDGLAKAVPERVELLVGIEARGFLLAAAVAHACHLGVVPARKPGKLPDVEHRVEYQLEYGSAALELPAGVVRAGQSVLIVDDVLATGGTLAAAARLLRAADAVVLGAVVVLELAALDGRAALSDLSVSSLARI